MADEQTLVIAEVRYMLSEYTVRRKADKNRRAKPERDEDRADTMTRYSLRVVYYTDAGRVSQVDLSLELSDSSSYDTTVTDAVDVKLQFQVSPYNKIHVRGNEQTVV